MNVLVRFFACDGAFNRGLCTLARFAAGSNRGGLVDLTL
jgi:hypothetical protein